MMQQIASKSTDLATSALPFDISVKPANGVEFAVVLQDSSMSAFEQARMNAESKASKTQLIEEVALDTENKQPMLNEQEALSISTADSHPSAAHLEKESSQATSEAEITLDESNQSNAVAIPSEQATLVQETQAIYQDQKIDIHEFDYIDYVSEVKQWHTDLNQMSEGAHAQNIETLSPLIEDDFSVESAQQEFAQFYLSEDDIKALLIENKQMLSQEQAEALELAISKLAEQVNDKQGLNNPQTLIENDSQLIKQVLTQVTQQPSLDKQDSSVSVQENDETAKQRLSQTPVDTIAAADMAASDTQVDQVQTERSARLQTLLTASDLNPEALSRANAQANEDNKLANGKLVDNIALDLALASSESIAASSLDADAKAASAMLVEGTSTTRVAEEMPNLATSKLVLNINKPEDPHTASLQQLSRMSLEAEQESLQNLSQRLMQTVSEIKPDLPKGGEFVAALQAGLKEFKSQLAQGREPGIDLKALVSEAFEKIDVNLSAQQVPKIEQSLQQFANTLNVALSVQQQQAQWQGLTPSETISAEKISQSVTDGTKLAPHQQNLSSFDKAVNIFKADGQQQLVERVRWMINGRNSAAEIRLDPPELGAMQIRINMTGEAASVNFVVQSQQAKDALDMAATRLRDMLQEQGIDLGQSSVEQQARDNREQHADTGADGSANTWQSGSFDDNDDLPQSNVITQRVAGNSLGGIDYYA